MRDEFLIDRQGRQFVLFAGLLDEAHAQGLTSIETELLQAPGSDNGDVCIIKARVTTEAGVFEGIGDASPNNVSRNIVPHLIRMAETRAKARALRDAINVGVAVLEETYDEAPASGQSASDRGSGGKVTDMRTAHERSKRAAEQGSKQGSRQGSAARGENPDKLPATQRQLNYLERLLEDNEEVRQRLEERYGKTVGKLTRGEASAAIAAMTGQRSG